MSNDECTPELTDEQAAWERISTELQSVVERLRAGGADRAQWGPIAGGAAVLVARLAATAEPAGLGPLSQLAALLQRMVGLRPAHGDHGDGSAADLYRVARDLRLEHLGLSSPQARTLMSLIMQLVFLLAQLAEHDAEQQTRRGHRGEAAAARSAALALVTLPKQTRTEVSPRSDAPSSEADPSDGRSTPSSVPVRAPFPVVPAER